MSLATCAGGIGIWDHDIVDDRLVWDDDGDTQMDEGAQIESADWDLEAQATPVFEVVLRTS